MRRPMKPAKPASPASWEREFRENAVAFLGERENVSVQGFAGLPTYSRAQGNMQFAFVNGRPVRDKLIAGAIRGAYADLMSRARFPALVLFLTCPPDRVDVNVHPAKSEVRFRDSAFVRGLIVSTIRAALASKGVASNTGMGARHGFKLPAHDVTRLWRFCRAPGRL